MPPDNEEIQDHPRDLKRAMETNNPSRSQQLISEQETLKSNSSVVLPTFAPFKRQTLAILGPFFAIISSGMVSGYSAILIPQLLQDDAIIRVSPADMSWIASIGVLPMGAGCFLGGYLMERYGRRATHMILCVPMVLGWVCIACAINADFILIGRFITGAASGILGPPSSVFIGEVSEPKYRGVFLGGISLCIALGILITHILGSLLTWKTTAIIGAFSPLLCYVFIAFVPESPAWLLSRGEIDAAEKSFKWLRGYGVDATNEFNSMLQRHITEKLSEKDKPKPTAIENLRTNLTKREFLTPLGIILVFFSTLQFSGVNAVVFYTVTILKETLRDGINEYVAMILIDLIRVVMSVVACICMKQYGRRPISLIGTSGTALSLIGLSVFLYVMANVPAFKELYWLPLCCFISFVIFTTLGLVPMPWCLIGEVFPLHQRGLGTGISTAWNFTAFFIVVKTSPTLFLQYGQVTTFLMYGCVALFGAIFLWLRLPETKNKTLQEIEDSFLTNKKVIQENNNIKV